MSRDVANTDPPNTFFPSRLFRFLIVVEDYDIAHIASWQPNGRSFRIHKPDEFENRTEPSWFVYKKYSSFQRQLNIYGFLRITNGEDKNCYYHEHFLRGQEQLLRKIIRMPMKRDAPSLVMPQVPHSDATSPFRRSVLNSTIQNHNENTNRLSLPVLSDITERVELFPSINHHRIVHPAIQSTVSADTEVNIHHRDVPSNDRPMMLSVDNTTAMNLQLHMMEQNHAVSIRYATDDLSSLIRSQKRRRELEFNMATTTTGLAMDHPLVHHLWSQLQAQQQLQLHWTTRSNQSFATELLIWAMNQPPPLHDPSRINDTHPLQLSSLPQSTASLSNWVLQLLSQQQQHQHEEQQW